jgi:class 3 adenylate cyclase
MPIKRDDPGALEIAHVLFMDIVGYSRLPMVRQAQLLRRLQNVVSGTKEFRRARSDERLLSLPTGDGMALVFFLDPIAPVRCAMDISRLLTQHPDINLRMGLHSGPVLRIADINKNKNVAGGGINTAQRVMDCGDGGHILLSKAVADVLLNLGNFEGYLHDWGEVTVKHGERVHVFSLCFEDLGKADLPSKLNTSAAAARPTGNETKQEGRVSTPHPSMGPLVHKLCDRSAQVTAFTDALISNFKHYRGTPQFYLIHGEEKECHDSLVDRLVNTNIKHLAEKHWGAQKGVVQLKKVSWAYEGGVAERQRELKRMLFSEFDPAYMEEDLSATTLSRVASLTLSPIIVVRHNIYVKNWDKVTRELLEWYFTYWAEVNDNPSSPQFVIFLNVIYPKVPAGRWWSEWLTSRKYNKERVKRDLTAITANPAGGYCCNILRELVTPRQHEVGDWLSFYNVYDEKKQDEIISQLFGRAEAALSMADIEHELKLIHQRFIKESAQL